jgi:hypothetical protein
MRSAYLPLVVVVCLIAGQLSAAPQTTVQSPFNTTSGSFFEQNSVSWSGNWGGVHFQFGSPNLANPTNGGFLPGAGLNTGFGIASGNFNANVALGFSQGARQSLTSQTPSLTLGNGQFGVVSDTSQTPFVISEVPVVGGGRVPMLAGLPVGVMGPLADAGDVAAPPPWANPQMLGGLPPGQQPPGAGGGSQLLPPPRTPRAQLANLPGAAAAAAGARRLFTAQESSAGRAAPSVAEARRLHDQEKAAEAGDPNVLMERAQTAEEQGKPGVAKIYYQMVVKRASGDLKSKAQARLEALRTVTTR